MNKFLNALRSRKGITMTEVVIAMAVVVIVTGAAISLLIASIRFDARYDTKVMAMNAAESAVECVRFANESDQLNEYLLKLGFAKADGNEGVYTCGEAKVVVTDDKWAVTLDDDTLYEKNIRPQS